MVVRHVGTITKGSRLRVTNLVSLYGDSPLESLARFEIFRYLSLLTSNNPDNGRLDNALSAKLIIIKS